jgi:hypothetical protein
MSNMNCRGTRAGPWLALLFCFLGLLLILPTTASAGGSKIWVAPPNGKYDTANIQAALNACVSRGPGCTVQLQAGKYFTKQLVTYNFRGTFKGMGINQTTVEALPNLHVDMEPVGGVPESLCKPDTTTCRWPSLILFVDGDIHVSDLSIYMTAPPGTATTPWNFAGTPFIGLFDALSFMGQHANVEVDRIHLEGLPDPTNGYDFNVVNGVHFTGEFPRSPTPWDWYFLSGSFTVRSSSFKNAAVGISQDGFVTSSKITIGGSPEAGNHFENDWSGIDIEASEKSVVEISYNESSGMYAGMWVVPWQPVFVPNSPSRYLIHDNKFIGTGQYADGFYFLDDATNPWIQAAAWNNTVQLQDTLSEGIGAYNTKGTVLWNNSVTGTDGFDAVGLYSSTLDTVINNNVSGFTVDSTVGNAQIYLDPSTTHDLVVCAERSDTVLNQGTNNTIIGCQQPTTTPAAATDSVAPAVSAHKPNLPKGKPQLH